MAAQMTTGQMIRKIEKATGMKYVPTTRMIKNDSFLFFDSEFSEAYSVHLRTGYARRAVAPTWGRGAVTVVDPEKGITHRLAQYQLNPRKPKTSEYGPPVGGYPVCYLYPQDPARLAEIIIRAHRIRHELNELNERGHPVPKPKVVKRPTSAIREDIQECSRQVDYWADEIEDATEARAHAWAMRDRWLAEKAKFMEELHG